MRYNTKDRRIVKDKHYNQNIGIDIPMSYNSGDGFFTSTKSSLSEARNSIMALLMTNRNERLMHPDMGCNLKYLLFEPNVDKTKYAVESNIINQISKWVKNVIITDLKVLTYKDNPSIKTNTIYVKLSFKLRGQRNVSESEDIELIIQE